MTQVEIRLAEPRDAEEIMRLIAEMHGEVGLFPLSAKSVASTVVNTIETGFVLIAERGGEVAGSVGLAVDEPWYSETRVLRDLWVYVRPAHRRSRAADQLLRHAKETARLAGLTLILGVQGSPNLGRTARLYERHFTPFGMLFIDARDG